MTPLRRTARPRPPLGPPVDVALAGLTLAFALLAEEANARPKLRVMGSSRFEAHASRLPGGGVAVSGTLVDDADHAVAGATLAVRFTSATGRSLEALACSAPDPAPRAGDGGSSFLTGPDGAFCARATPSARDSTETVIDLSWEGTHLLSAARASLAIDPSRAAVTLRFEPELRTIWLGGGPVVSTVAARVEGESDAADGDPSGLLLHLLDERGTPLGDATTDTRGSARFIVPESRLGAPGPGELRLAFDGDGRRARASLTTSCERRVAVVVAPHVREPVRDGGAGATLEAEDSEDQSIVDLDVTSAAGLVPGGSVEGRVDGAVVGAAPVMAGRARLGVSWPGATAEASAGLRHLEVRYVPSAPWYVAGPATPLDVSVHRSPPWRRFAVVMGGLALLAWFVASRSWRFALPRRRGGVGLAPPQEESPRIELVEPEGPDARAWRGRVVDTHDGAVIQGARLTLERSSFGGVVEVASATSDDAGRFVLDATSMKAGDQITAAGPLHGKVTRPAPARGVLEVALVARRRAVLRRLVDWAQRRGAPFDAPPEPTPAHIVRMASEDARTARWARAVEDAAFSPRPVDAERETEVDALGHEADKPRP